MPAYATRRTTILPTPTCSSGSTVTSDRDADDQDRRHRGGDRDLPGRARGGPGAAVPGDRQEHPRPPVAGRAVDRDGEARRRPATRGPLGGDPARSVGGGRGRGRRRPQPSRGGGLVLACGRAAPARGPRPRGAGPAAAARARRAATQAGSRRSSRTRSGWSHHDGDLTRAVVLMREAAEHRPQLADALLVATAERLGIRRVASFDRRPLAASGRATCGPWSSSPRRSRRDRRCRPRSWAIA